MRFTANGPSIPSELLLARDQGRVVFFCGAGVSIAKARLPDFFGLAEKVTKTLRVQKGSDVGKLLNAAKVIDSQIGVTGLISADRIFGLLERAFPAKEINAAVASALKPSPSCDLSAHQTLVKLATTREGQVRLVTTNFDRLFDGCKQGLTSFQPPDLPNPTRPGALNGIVYLHGKANPEYDGAEGDGFVLSSSEFGRAYLSEGWATSFFKEIIDRYSVVFIGYTADDPPVQYLLEALNKTSAKVGGVYAFQLGDANYASSRWLHKGVEAIPYGSEHATLWTTLEAWAERAEDPEGWTKRVIELAQQGPENLEPYQRGQVAHIVETQEGARKFSEGENPPPATWLCVFDPSRRFERPGRARRYEESSSYVDPFDLFGLDSDVVPSKHAPEDHSARREPLKGAWSAFEISKIDRLNINEENTASFQGSWATSAPRLPRRLEQLGHWISRVSNQPAAVWWAAHQTALHPDIQKWIGWQLERANTIVSQPIQTAWHFLFDYWTHHHSRQNNSDFALFELQGFIKKNGWGLAVVRRFARATRPHIEAKSNFLGGPIPPTAGPTLTLHDLVYLDVKYPDLAGNFEIPDEWLRPILAQLRRNLEIAIELESEIGRHGLRDLAPIAKDSDPNISLHERTHGLSGWMLLFVRHFKRLLELNPEEAEVEFSRWPSDDDSVFARLKIWASGESALVPSASFGTVFERLSDEVFWSSSHARDLLLTLASRWNGLSDETKDSIEMRILKAPPQWSDENVEDYVARRAWTVLNRLQWLKDNGCILRLDFHAVRQQLRKEVPDWKPEHASAEAQSRESRSGWVRTETESSALLAEPVRNILKRAVELSGRRGIEFVEYDPFGGLVKDHPIKAFAALKWAAKDGDYPDWAWRTFLNPDYRKSDSLRFITFIARYIVRQPPNELSDIVRFAADWVRQSAKTLAAETPSLFADLIGVLLNVLQSDSELGTSTVPRGSKEIDWATAAINAPAGRLAEALFDDVQIDNLEAGAGLPAKWRENAEQMLSLIGDLRRHTLVIFSYRLSWLFWVDSEWTKRNLLAVLETENDEDREAFWSGVLWRGKLNGADLFRFLKPHMLTLAVSGNLEKRGHTEALAGLILSAWGLVDGQTGERWISNDELCDVLLSSTEEFRTQTLWLAGQWASTKSDADAPANWPTLIVQLLRDAWPRQTAVRSAEVSARLCNLAFSNAQRFADLALIILPLLTKVDANRLFLPGLRKTEDAIVDSHSELVLALLHAILPDNASLWPYEIHEIVDHIGVANPELSKDERLIELRRIWDSR